MVREKIGIGEWSTRGVGYRCGTGGRSLRDSVLTVTRRENLLKDDFSLRLRSVPLTEIRTPYRLLLSPASQEDQKHRRVSSEPTFDLPSVTRCAPSTDLGN